MKAKSPADRGIWIVGYNPVKEALRSPAMLLSELLVARDDRRTVELLGMAAERGIAVRREPFEALSGLVGHTHHQGVALRLAEFHYSSLESILQAPLEQRQPLLALDSLQDPQNLGAIIRSACFLGAAGLVLPKDRAAGISGTVIKIAAGAAAYLPLIQVVNLVQSLERLKESGLWVVGMAVDGDQVLYEANLTLPLVLVVGNEQKGLRPLVRQHCDFLVRIPTNGPLASLNAATAGAIALAEVQRQQRLAKKSVLPQKGPSQF